MQLMGAFPALSLALAGLLVLTSSMQPASRRGLAMALVALALVVGIAGLAAVGKAEISAPRSGKNSWLLWCLLGVLLFLHAGFAISLIRAHDNDATGQGEFSISDPRRIDCYTFQRDAAKDLTQGGNPYGATRANIYDPTETKLYYGPGLVVNGRVQVGFQYPPVTLLCALGGYLAGDVRYGYIAVTMLSALFAFAMAPDKRGLCLAAFILLSPATQFVEARSWTESLVWMLLCATVYAAVKRPRWLPLALGLFLASKQYNFLALPLVGLPVQPFTWKGYWKLLGLSLAVAVATVLPFAVLNFGALWHDLVLFHLQQPLRPDAFSFAILFPLYMKIGPLLLLAFIVWILRRGPHRAGVFAAAYGIALLLFVSGSKQAFPNYYFLIAQSLLLAATALWPAAQPRIAQC